MASGKKATFSPEDLARYNRRLLDRLLFFSDSVFAIAITLLVLNLTVPVIASSAVNAELPSALLALEPKLASYVISFFVIGMYWMAHQRAFVYVERYDRGVAWLTLSFLLFIVFLPFPTALLGAYGEHVTAVVFYAVVLSISSLLLVALWVHISHNHRLLAERVPAQFIRANTERHLSMPIVFMASIAVAFVSTTAAEVMWILGLSVHLVLGRRTRVA